MGIMTSKHKNMTDKEWIDMINAIMSQEEALNAVVKYEHLLGTDPYYKAFHRALLNMCARCAKLPTK